MALSHDWLTGMRGGERVLEILCQGFPQADIYTLLHKTDAVSNLINTHTIHTSPLQHIPRIERSYRYFLPFHPWAVSRLRPAPADLLISTSHCVAKGLPRPPGARHLCYCFTPMRYAWTFYEEYFGRNPIKKMALEPILKALRKWDHDRSSQVDRFVAISRHVQKRIQRYYGRDADVVYPPVNTERCRPGEPGHDDFDLIVSALVPYKRIDLAVQAYNRLKRKLIIVGTGTEFEKLKTIAGANITFTGWKNDADILSLYQRCRLLIFPGEEDFGIVPVEAQACGKPVVAFGRGGAMETVVHGETGLHFPESNAHSLEHAVSRALAVKWDASHIRKNAERFSHARFIDGLNQSVRKCLRTE